MQGVNWQRIDVGMRQAMYIIGDKLICEKVHCGSSKRIARLNPADRRLVDFSLALANFALLREQLGSCIFILRQVASRKCNVMQ